MLMAAGLFGNNMDKKITIGIFQGRLTPSRGRGIQFFPFEEWRNEFAVMNQRGLDEVEFIFDKERMEENPLWKTGGAKEIVKIAKENRITIKHICADYFMREPFHKSDPEERKRNVQLLKDLLYKAKEVGAVDVEIPFLDNSSIRTEEDKKIVTEALFEGLEIAKSLNMDISLEADLRPLDFEKLLLSIESPNLKVTYDSGNSSALGYDAKEELEILGRYLSNFHLKDRIKRNGTVSLGTGDANFEEVFLGLKKVNYRGSITLQVARGEEGREAETTGEHIRFLNSYVEKYLN